ncbi:MAG TPA: S8/S53 family peptidase, partial [Chroococcidiopsis sp.]
MSVNTLSDPPFFPVPNVTASPIPQVNGSTMPLVGLIDTAISPDFLGAPLPSRRECSAGAQSSNILSDKIGVGDRPTHGDRMLQLLQPLGTVGISTVWLGATVGSGRWAESLAEFVAAVEARGCSPAVINLSFDLIWRYPDGRIRPRQGLSPAEYRAIAQAQRAGVVLVVAAGNDGGGLTGLAQAAAQFDNICVVGAAEGNAIAPYSSRGVHLSILAEGTAEGHSGTSIAAARVSAAVAQLWAANSALSYRQVLHILRATATPCPNGPDGSDTSDGSDNSYGSDGSGDGAIAASPLRAFTRPVGHLNLSAALSQAIAPTLHLRHWAHL